MFIPAQYWVSLLIIGSAVLCQFQKDTLFNHIQLNLHYKYIIKPYRLKLSCTIPSTYLQLEGFRNYIAAILTKWPQRYPLLARLGYSTVSACQLSLSFAVHLSVLSACCVFILLHIVSLCSVVFLYSLSVHSVCQCAFFGAIFQYEALFVHLHLRRCPRFAELLSSCCIKAFFSYYILRCSHILFWGFVLIFYTEASSSYFILRLCSSVWGLGPRCCRPMLLLFVLLIWFVCSDMCVILFLFVFVYRVTRCKHHLVWIYQPFSCFTFLCQFFSLQSCNPLFWFTCQLP